MGKGRDQRRRQRKARQQLPREPRLSPHERPEAGPRRLFELRTRGQGLRLDFRTGCVIEVQGQKLVDAPSIEVPFDPDRPHDAVLATALVSLTRTTEIED